MRSITSPLIDGGRYRIEVPDAWDGTLILYSQGPPADRNDPVWSMRPILQAFLDRRYAVAGWASPMFWPLEQSFVDQALVLDDFVRLVGTPQRTIAYGESIGGILTAGLVQQHPARLDGALALCGPLAGGVATHNRELDISFVFATLESEQQLELVRITDADANLRAAIAELERAMATPSGRARIALAAAVSEVPAVANPRRGDRAPHDARTRLDAQVNWFRDVVFLVTFSARATVERRAGGNPSWNTGVDYGALVDRSLSHDTVNELYADAALDLAADLDRLASARRISADAAAVQYLERYIAFTGKLGGVPVVTMHTTGDGLCPPEHEHAYADVVRQAGDAGDLRQLWLNRGGHCTFTPAEVFAALDLLGERIDSGHWPATDPATLNAAAAAFGPAFNAFPDGAGTASPIARPSQFGTYAPRPFTRPHDGRMAGTR